MDVDSQARLVLDRMAVDIAQMVKRSDVDYYFKTASIPQTIDPATNPTGNDQMAFFSTVSGYYPPAGSQSPVSLIAYRVNGASSSPVYVELERMGKGLLWNGVTPPSSPAPTAVPMIFLPQTISAIPAWSGAIQPSPDPNYFDPDYELVGPYVFRFEYSYLLKGFTYFDTVSNTYKTNPSIASDTPWDTRPPLNHTTVSGMQDVAAISVVIAAIPPKSRLLLSNSTNPPQLITLASRMNDFVLTMKPGDLAAQWQAALDGTTDMPRSAIAGVRIYQRYFYLLSKL
jgi:hypothetical protein